LYDLLHTKKVPLKDRDKFNMCLQIAYGLAYLHRINVVHNVTTIVAMFIDSQYQDLSSKNILLDKNLIPKITDFSQSGTLYSSFTVRNVLTPFKNLALRSLRNQLQVGIEYTCND
jgi:serine/threonine protein kinase